MIVAAVSMLSVAACTRVEPGHVGVKVNQYGSDAGVENAALGVGTYWTMIGTTIYEYPIFTNSYVWSRREDANEELSFQDKNGLVVTADVTVAYRVDPQKAPKLFQTYRVDMDGIVAGPLRNKVRSAIVAAASTMTVEDVYGPKKTVLINAALKNVRAYFEPLGLHVDQLDWAGPVRIPDSILDRINARAQNEQAAIAAQATVATMEAEGRARVAKAEADAKATTIRAEAEAKAIKTRAEAIANNPKIVAYQWVQKWDGKMPSTVYCSAASPCIQGGSQ
ncbi:prohibitin family protein [Rhizorhabdus wittichii]|jgi:regulator of protease activity HflC (stomatin/prohibitin superfamily)|uniref:Prohibitin family protein n=2 Tax=Rhizorhabdus wittichii TaxID=160791 RepID=A0A975HIC3_9SPHN|nr:prohibitin family protein [Rhizorhabdus wittichii]